VTDERFWGKVNRRGADECWEWTGALDRQGYGRVGRRKASLLAHRYALELTLGEIPPELCACHRCDNPPCCNPAHLFLGTRTENSRDAKRKRRFAHGERHYRAKLTAADVTFIRVGRHIGIRQARLAREFGVSFQSISDVDRGRHWAHTLDLDAPFMVGPRATVPTEADSRLDIWKAIALSLRAYHLQETA